MQGDSDIPHKYLNMFCDTNQFPSLQLFVPHTKPNGIRGLIKNYLFWFNTRLGYGICEIGQITCICVECMSMLDKPWVTFLAPNKQSCYQTVHDLT